MHPHNEHRQHKVEHSRVAHITKGYAAGGAVVTANMGQGKKQTKKAEANRDAMAVMGKPAKERADRPHRAAGGKVNAKGKHKGVNVNVIVAPQGGHPGMGAPAPMPAGASPPILPMRPPAPPMAPPGAPGAPMAGPGPMAGGMPPAMPPRRSGGRTYAKGGAVKDGPAYQEGLKNGTQVQHSNNKKDGKDIGRGRVVTFRTGGAVEASGKVEPATKMPGGSGGGEARLFKEHRAARNYKKA